MDAWIPQLRLARPLLIGAWCALLIATLALLPGDLAITENGIHVLAYLGGDEWIQAEPNLGAVIVLAAPSENIWYNQDVWIMRWADLADQN